MNIALNDILEFYEEERVSLEKLIKLHIQEREYKQAHVQNKALKNVNQLLSLLKNLENQNYQEIEHLQFQLDNYSDTKFTEMMAINPAAKDFIESKKQIIQQEIQTLLNQAPDSHIDSQEFDDVIFDLVEGKLKKFHFFLNTETNLYLDFKKVNQSIIITIPKYKKLKKNHVLLKSSRSKLKDIGFKLTDNKKRLVYVYDISSFKDANPIKTIISRVIYEGFGHQNIKNSSVIAIID